MRVTDLQPDIIKKIKKHNLQKKFTKAKLLFEQNPRHPSLNTERLEPKDALIYSFRLDKKFRAHFIITSGHAEIIDVTVHYQ